MSINSNGLSIEWGPLVDLQNDVKPFLQIPQTQTTGDTMLQMLIDGISDWLQREVGRPIARSRFTWKTGADGFSSVLMLPYTPVLEIISCTEYWGISGPHPLTESVPTDQTDGFQIDYTTGALTRVFQGLVQKPWFPGSDNIWVTFDAGFNPTPPGARLAVMEAIKWYWDNTQQEARSGPMAAAANREGWQGPAKGDTTGFWSSVLPTILAPLVTQYMQVGIG